MLGARQLQPQLQFAQQDDERDPASTYRIILVITVFLIAFQAANSIAGEWTLR